MLALTPEIVNAWEPPRGREKRGARRRGREKEGELN